MSSEQQMNSEQMKAVQTDSNTIEPGNKWPPEDTRWVNAGQIPAQVSVATSSGAFFQPRQESQTIVDWKRRREKWQDLEAGPWLAHTEGHTAMASSSRSLLRRLTPYVSARLRQNQRLLSSTVRVEESPAEVAEDDTIQLTENCIRVTLL
ncbi:hypothetical protein ACLOJK_040702 [Asimina triloba]